MSRRKVVSRDMAGRDVWKTTKRHTSLDNLTCARIASICRKTDDRFSLKVLGTVLLGGFIQRDVEEL